MKSYCDMFRAIVKSADIKVSRGFTDFVSDKLVQALTKREILAAIEQLAGLLNSNLSYIAPQISEDFLKVAQKEESKSFLAWARKYPKQLALILMIREPEVYEEMVSSLEIPKISSEIDQVEPTDNYNIKVTVTCLAPLAHGGDQKAGNATIFRRVEALTKNDSVLLLPAFSANSWRHKVREHLADHFLEKLGLVADGVLAKWFFHTLYSGGSLEEKVPQEKGKQEKGKDKKNLADVLGKDGENKGYEIQRLRQMIPMLSVFGGALAPASRIIEGYINPSDLRPVCFEWGTGQIAASSLFDWSYFTKSEPDESYEIGSFSGLPVNTEVLKIGTVLKGGIDYRFPLSEIEKACLFCGLKLLKTKGYIGAEGRRGHGKIRFEFEMEGDDKKYIDFLTESKEEILGYLKMIGALA
jgi:hypothetical protein